MKKLHVVLCFTILLLQSCTGQNYLDKLKSDKDVVWIAEKKLTVQLDGEIDRKESRLNKQEELLISKQNYSYFEGREKSFWDYIKKSVEEGNLTVKNEVGEMVDSQTFLELSQILYTYKKIHPNTKEEIIGSRISSRYDSHPFEFDVLLTYDIAENSFSVLVKSLTIPTHKGGELTIGYPLDGESFSIHSKDCPLGRLVKIEDIEFIKADILKGDTDVLFKELFYTNVKEGKSKAFEWDWTDKDLLELDSVTVDTFVSFDPETYEETIEVAYNDPIDWSKKPRYGVDLEFMWDNKRNRIFCRLIAIGPMEDSYEGEPLGKYNNVRKYKIAN